MEQDVPQVGELLLGAPSHHACKIIDKNVGSAAQQPFLEVVIWNGVRRVADVAASPLEEVPFWLLVGGP